MMLMHCLYVNGLMIRVRDFQEQWMGNKVSYPLDCDKNKKT